MTGTKIYYAFFMFEEIISQKIGLPIHYVSIIVECQRFIEDNVNVSYIVLSHTLLLSSDKNNNIPTLPHQGRDGHYSFPTYCDLLSKEWNWISRQKFYGFYNSTTRGFEKGQNLKRRRLYL